MHKCIKLILRADNTLNIVDVYYLLTDMLVVVNYNAMHIMYMSKKTTVDKLFLLFRISVIS